MVSEVAFEQISGVYWYGAYGPFRVVMDKSNGYVNATKMCVAGGKDYYDWSRLKSTHLLIATLQKVLALENIRPGLENYENTLGDPTPGNPGDGSIQCFKVVLGGTEAEDWIIRGTYIHPDLVPSLAGWVSPEFQIKANRVVNAYITNQYRVKVAEYEAKQVNMREDLARSQMIEGWHLDHLNVLQDVLKEKEVELQEKDVLNALTEIQLEVCTLAEQSHLEAKEQAVEQCEVVIEKKKLQLDTWGNSHALTMMRLNDPEARLPLYVIRCKRSSMNKVIKRRQEKHPNSTIIYQNLKVPNPINLYNRLKASGILTFKRNYCITHLTEVDLIAKLGELYNVVQ
jgi:hypothetical protein